MILSGFHWKRKLMICGLSAVLLVIPYLPVITPETPYSSLRSRGAGASGEMPREGVASCSSSQL